MKTLAFGMVIAAFAASPALAECSWSKGHSMAMSTLEQPVQMSVKLPEANKAYDVASIPTDGWLVKHLDQKLS